MAQRLALNAVASDDIQALVLAGGLGTRLRSVVSDRPKVLASIDGTPFLAYLLRQIVGAGVRRAVICVGYMGSAIEETFGPCFDNILGLTYSYEREALGTAGALRLALPLIDSETVLVMNGDTYVATDFAAFVRWHGECGWPGSMAMARVPDAARFGTVDADPDGRVTALHEKRGEATPDWVNAGLYMLGRGLIETIPAGRAVSIEREMLPAWIDQGFGGWRTDATFLDIGTPESLAGAAAFLGGLDS